MIDFSGLQKGKLAQKTIGVFEITPAFAKKLLNESKDCHNRPINRPRINQYKNDMLMGAWSTKTDGSLIYVGEDGKIRNGQHRLSALIEANITLPFEFRQVNDEDVFNLPFDANLGRTGHQGTGEPKSFCGLVNAWHKIFGKVDCPISNAIIVQTANKLKERELYDNVILIMSGSYHIYNIPKENKIPIWARYAFATALLLGYKNTLEIWKLFAQKGTDDLEIKETVEYKISQLLWTFIWDTKDLNMRQKNQRHYMLKFLIQMKKQEFTSKHIMPAFEKEITQLLRDFYED